MSMKLLKLVFVFLLPLSLALFADDSVKTFKVTSQTNCLKESKSNDGLSYDKCMALKIKDIILKIFNPNEEGMIYGHYCGFNDAFYRDNTTETYEERLKEFKDVKSYIYDARETLTGLIKDISQYSKESSEMKLQLMVNFYSELQKLNMTKEKFRVEEAKLCPNDECKSKLPVTFTQEQNDYGLDTFCFYHDNCVYRKRNIIDIECDSKFAEVLGKVYAQILEENVREDNHEIIDDAAVREIVALLYVTYQVKVVVENGLSLVTHKNVKLSPEQYESVAKYADLVANAIEYFGIDHIVSSKIGTWAPVFNSFAAQHSEVFNGISYAASFIPKILAYLPELNQYTGGALATFATAVVTYSINKCRGRASGEKSKIE